MSEKFVIDSIFSLRKKFSVFLAQKILSELLSEISEKIDASTFVFSIEIQRANRSDAASKFAIFPDSKIPNRLRMLHETTLMSE
jgi:hypothetical protein